MGNLYFVGGSVRTGKTSVLLQMLQEKTIIAVHTDAFREAARYAVTEEPFISIQDLSFEGDVTFHRSGEGNEVSHTKHFSCNLDQEELTWKMIVGFINYYDRKPGISIIIEGTIITPARVSSLVLKHLKVRAVFFGFY